MWIRHNGRVTSLSNQPLSPLDGRYRGQVGSIAEHLSEAGLNRARILVEIEWLIWLVDEDLLATGLSLSDTERQALRAIATEFGEAEVAELAEIEATTRHDVKAVEYFVRARLGQLGRSDLSELVHFACTSEDINNLAYALTVREAINQVWLPRATELVARLDQLAAENAEVAMLSRTHGQPATPTTLGKELAVFSYRLNRQLGAIREQPYLGKFSGATGTFAAHLAAAPGVDWLGQSRAFVASLGLDHNPVTTQIESHDWQAELYARVSHVNRICHNLATDFWTYISLNYFTQIPVPGATGSSTMPHKINPIRFENAEANLEISCALLDSLAATLVTSRLQRDLTDSSAQRNIGVAMGHSLLALDNLLRGLDEVAVNRGVISADLMENWEVLGEAIQTVIRAEVVAGRSKITDPYALLKDLTRGKRVDEEGLAVFINRLDVSDAAKERLLLLKPSRYIGLAAEIAKLERQ
jgi:adenylosuccinate lyase